MRYSPPRSSNSISTKTLAAAPGTVKLSAMIIDRIDPIVLRIPAAGGNMLCLTLSRVVTRDGVEGYGECLSLRPPMQRALYATIRDAIAPHYLGKSVDDREALNLAARERFAGGVGAGPVLSGLGAVALALGEVVGKVARRSVPAVVGRAM